MNKVIETLFERKSVRQYTDNDISAEEKKLILESALQAPTAGNQVLYTILDIEDQAIKNKLAVLCDNQPFIARSKDGSSFPCRLSEMVECLSIC